MTVCFVLREFGFKSFCINIGFILGGKMGSVIIIFDGWYFRSFSPPFPQDFPPFLLVIYFFDFTNFGVKFPAF